MERPYPPFGTDVDDDSSEEDAIKTREERAEVFLPARLIRSSPGVIDEVIPAMVVNVSASGIQLMTDRRFSLSLPPYLGVRFAIEFFLDAIEIRHVSIEVVRSEKRQGHRVFMGCKFVDLPTQARLSLRALVAARVDVDKR